jgi:hypothetical protein
VDGCQGQGILEESSSGSRGSYWAVALIMVMTFHERKKVLTADACDAPCQVNTLRTKRTVKYSHFECTLN